VRKNLRERRSLSDSALAKLLSKLRQYQPQVIGLDIYQDFGRSRTNDLTTYLQDERFIAVCDVGEDDYRVALLQQSQKTSVLVTFRLMLIRSFVASC